MKKKSSSQSAFFNVRVLIRLFIILVGIFLALLGLGGFSNVFAQPKISTRDSAGLFSVPTFSAQGSYDVSGFSLPTTDGGSALDGFDPNANGPVYVVVVQPDGKILIGGGFTTLSPNGGPPVTRNHIARLNPDGTLDNAFDPNANDFVNSIAVQADGKILAGGAFNGANSIGGQTRNRIARLDAVSGLADSFDPNADSESLFNHGAGGRQDFSGRRFQALLVDRRATASHGSIPRPAWLIRSTRTRKARDPAVFNRGAGGRQDSSGRLFPQHRRTDPQQHRTARSHDRLG